MSSTKYEVIVPAFTADAMDSSEVASKGWRKSLAQNHQSELPAIVALGKFDALHRGHQSLAIASAALGGQPWLISFSGMAQVLGWPSRHPLVASVDRARVLETWRESCRGYAPHEHLIPFAEIREMEPEEFIQMLAQDLGVSGVVVGANYRFGYKARGDAALLKAVAPTYGMKVEIVNLFGSGKASNGEVVSSSRVRNALSVGDMQEVTDLLGRPYRLVLSASEAKISASKCPCLPKSGAHNQPPAVGQYKAMGSYVPWSNVLHAGAGSSVQVVVSTDAVEIQGLELGNKANALVTLDFVT